MKKKRGERAQKRRGGKKEKLRLGEEKKKNRYPVCPALPERKGKINIRRQGEAGA